MLNGSREQGDGATLLDRIHACLPDGGMPCQEFICMGPKAATERESCQREELSGDEESFHHCR